MFPTRGQLQQAGEEPKKDGKQDEEPPKVTPKVTHRRQQPSEEQPVTNAPPMAQAADGKLAPEAQTPEGKVAHGAQPASRESTTVDGKVAQVGFKAATCQHCGFQEFFPCLQCKNCHKPWPLESLQDSLAKSLERIPLRIERPIYSPVP